MPTLTRPFRRRLAAAATLLLAALSVRGETTSSAAWPSITLADAVSRTLADNPAVEAQRQRVQQAKGTQEIAKGTFDWIAFAQLQASTRSDAINPPPPVPTMPDFARTDRATETIGVSRKLANGITLIPSAALQTEENDTVAGSAITRSDVGVTFRIPLARGFGRDATEADLRAGTLGLEARRELARQEIAAKVARTTGSYWRVLAAAQRLSLARDAQAGAARLADNIRGQVQGGELESALLDEANADVLRRKSAVLSAEQELVEARQDLGFNIGLTPEQLLSAPVAADFFPAISPVSWSPENHRALATLALEKRGDLAATRLQQEVQQTYLRRAANARRTRVDLDIRTALSGSAPGTDYNAMGKAAKSDLDGYNLTAALNIEWPVLNHAARGDYRRLDAALHESETNTIESRNSIAATVAVAAEALASASAQHAFAAETSAAFGRVVESQRNKFGKGETSLSTLVQNQDRYYDARAAEIQTARAYFNALVQLRLVTGTLVDRREDAYELALGALSTPPPLQ